MTQDRKRFSIVKGPSKFDLMLSLFDGNKEPRRTVELHLEEARAPIAIAITAIEQENGSGESWIFKGYLTNYRRGFAVSGFYSSSGRKGFINFITPFHYEMNGDQKIHVERPADQLDLTEYVKWLRGNGDGWPIPHADIYLDHE